MLVDRLLHLPGALRTAEEELLEAAAHYAEARLALECRESDLLIRGVEGANEAQRKARLHIGTLSAQEALQDAAHERDRCAAHLRTLQAELGALRDASRLLAGFSGGGDEDGP
jgi:hypothetical protein